MATSPKHTEPYVVEGAMATPRTSGSAYGAVMCDSLSSLKAYGSSSSEDEDSEDDGFKGVSGGPSIEPLLADNGQGAGVAVSDVNEYRERNTSSSSSSSEDSSSSAEDSSVEEINEEVTVVARGAKSKTPVEKPIAADGEMSLDELPPVDISGLSLNVKEEDCLHMGNIISIVDRLVMVQALPDMPAYDLDTLLFLEKGKRPLGHVFDVIGQVTSPMYAIRFNSKEEIDSKGIKKEQAVYSVPNNTEHTQYVFLKQLMKMKGSDASWKNDAEVPVEFVDFSDDEVEYNFSKQHQNESDTYDNRRKRNSVERHRMFETAMNLKNKVDSARRRMHERREAPPPKRFVPQNVPQQQQGVYFPPPPAQCPPFAPQTFMAPPPNLAFLRMPPPIFGMPPPFPTPFGPPMASFPHPQPFATFGPPAVPPMPPQPLPNFSGAAPSPHAHPQTQKSFPPTLNLPKPNPPFAPAAPRGPPRFPITVQQWGYGAVACNTRPFEPQKGGCRKSFTKR